MPEGVSISGQAPIHAIGILKVKLARPLTWRKLSQMTLFMSGKLTARIVRLLEMPIISQFINQQVY